MPLTLTRQDMQKKLAHAFDPKQTASLVDVLDSFREAELERAADTRELKEGLAALTQEVRKLTIAQQRTDSRLAEHQEMAEEQSGEIKRGIYEIQQYTDIRFADLAASQQQNNKQLTQFQQRIEEQLATLHQETMERLARQVEKEQASRAYWDEQFGRTDQQFAELATTQTQTSRAIEQLVQTVGALANDFGFSLEEFTGALLPSYLERYYGIRSLALERQHFEMESGDIEEVDLVGEGERDGRPVWVLAECRAKIGGGETRRLSRKLADVAALRPTITAVPIIVAMNVHPTAEAAAADTGVLLLPYSRINRDRG